MAPDEIIKKALSRLKTDKLDLDNMREHDLVDVFGEKYEQLIPILEDALTVGLKTANHFKQNSDLAMKHLKMELLMSLAILGVKKKKTNE